MTEEAPQKTIKTEVNGAAIAATSEPRKFGSRNNLVVGIIIGVITTVLSSALIDWLEISDPHLVYSDDLPRIPELVSGKVVNDKYVLHVKTRLGFRNWGLKSGHIDKIEVVRMGLNSYPEKVEILHLDKTDIKWLRKRDITSEFIIYADLGSAKKAAEGKRSVEFRIHYYGAMGNEITWQSIRLEGPTPSADGSCDKICL